MTAIQARRRSSGPASAANRIWDAGPLTKVTLAFALVLSAFPIYYMFIMATRTNDEALDTPPPLLPGGHLGENVERLLATEDAYFATGLINSIIISTTVTLSVVIISTLAGFAFAKLRFRGSKILLGSILLTMMVPLQQMGIVPLYEMMVNLGWTGQIQAVILPFLVNGFGVFMMTQYTTQAVPDELVEAARVDGASTMRIYANVILPAVRPGMAVLALLTFMQNWNEFLWPSIVLNPDNPVVQTSIAALNQAHGTDYVMLFTGTAASVLPLVIVFVMFGRQIVGGLMEGAVKA
ncbi:carbohydrate ABC transporter permease [Planomonospora parontospora]|uniref:carbohydrate ABC transporter permease n=1 Tax=Planomonospora parontospora TaxID=58119 RepID=UPI00166FDD08|nr:carbohydrate ABC transporter permease [Planomonospora parontospora]GGL24738.1 sugar ABC transporter permease [Planomonospora parontospora subsp. antibiotica]GII16422.1 sugar ABC transporter permease [Planomonospora parontospora subsp. antibiotica]